MTKKLHTTLAQAKMMNKQQLHQLLVSQNIIAKKNSYAHADMLRLFANYLEHTMESSASDEKFSAIDFLQRCKQQGTIFGKQHESFGKPHDRHFAISQDECALVEQYGKHYALSKLCAVERADKNKLKLCFADAQHTMFTLAHVQESEVSMWECVLRYLSCSDHKPVELQQCALLGDAWNRAVAGTPGKCVLVMRDVMGRDVVYSDNEECQVQVLLQHVETGKRNIVDVQIVDNNLQLAYTVFESGEYEWQLLQLPGVSNLKTKLLVSEGMPILLLCY